MRKNCALLLTELRKYAIFILGDSMNELKKMRQDLGISQIEAASILGISRRTYQKYESQDSILDNKLQYFIFKLKEFNAIDEEHGILTIDDIKRIVNDVLVKYKVNFCYLFGSYAKNKATPSSDVDLLVDTEITGLDFFGLIEELRISLHKKIDLLKINQLDNNHELLKEILKYGIKIYG